MKRMKIMMERKRNRWEKMKERKLGDNYSEPGLKGRKKKEKWMKE